MKLAMIVNDEFRKTVAKLATQPLPVKTAYKLKGVLKIMDAEFAKYEECRQEALRRFADKDGDVIQADSKGNVKLSPENLKAFVMEIQELTNVEIEIPSLMIEELGDKMELTTSELFLLDGFLV